LSNVEFKQPAGRRRYVRVAEFAAAAAIFRVALGWA